MTGHSHGCESDEWIHSLETIDAGVRQLIGSLGKGDGVLVTADHGVLDIPQHGHILVDERPELLEGVRFIAGEPRCIQVHFDHDTPLEVRAETIAQWRAQESHRAWIATRDEAIEAGWFGEVRADVAPRIGDFLVAARKAVAYYDSRTLKPHANGMIGQHGSWSPAELRVPLLRFGAIAR